MEERRVPEALPRRRIQFRTDTPAIPEQVDVEAVLPGMDPGPDELQEEGEPVPGQ
jgi:hypothetical protein